MITYILKHKDYVKLVTSTYAQVEEVITTAVRRQVIEQKVDRQQMKKVAQATTKRYLKALNKGKTINGYTLLRVGEEDDK